MASSSGCVQGEVVLSWVGAAGKDASVSRSEASDTDQRFPRSCRLTKRRQFLEVYANTFEDGAKPPYDILYDVESTTARELGILDKSVDSKILAMPTTLLLDGQRRIRYAYVGRDLADRPSAGTLLRAIRRIQR